MQKNCKESRLGRFSYLLKGGARPRRNYALMIALVCMVLLSFAGIVSADDSWKGTPPVTKLNGTVTGGVNVTLSVSDTWKSDNPIDNDNTTATFSYLPTSDVQFGRLYIVPYTGNMTENWKGNLTVTLTRSGYSDVVLLNAYPLDLDYDRTAGTTCNPSVSVPPFTSTANGLCRVTSDYLAILNVTPYMTSSSMKLYINTTNESGRFDGRIKEAKLVYGWNQAGGSNIKYWINEGQDPITQNIGTYTGNQTSFYDVPTSGTGTLWVDYLASSTGKGKYWWNDVELGTPTINKQGTYAGLSKWVNLDLDDSGSDVLAYTKTNNWYKIIVAVLTVP